MRTSVLALAAAAVLAVAGTGALLTARGEDGTGAGRDDLPPATTEVVSGTLTDKRTEDGILGYGTERPATAGRAGTMTWLPEESAVVVRGERLYELDGRAVRLLRGRVPAWRDLAPGAEGADVRQLEQNLRALGYDGFEVDDEYTWATADAVEEWQEELGVPETGTVALGDVVFLPDRARVGSLRVSVGDLVAPGQAVLGTTGTAPAATVELDPGQRRMARDGASVTIGLPDGSTVRGRIEDLRTEVTEADPADPGGEDTTTLVVTAALLGDEGRRAARSYDTATVDVTFVAGERPDVLMVPVAALLALREGGYGLEVVDGGRSTYVAVEVGLFSGGMVEVSGEGIAEGTVVGVPA